MNQKTTVVHRSQATHHLKCSKKKKTRLAFLSNATPTPCSVWHVVHLMSRSFLGVSMLGTIIGGLIRLVHQGFILKFDREDLVAEDLIHLPTTAKIGFDNHSVLRFHLPVKRKQHYLHQLRTLRPCDESRFPHVFCLSGVAPSIMRQVHVVSAVHQRTQG